MHAQFCTVLYKMSTSYFRTFMMLNCSKTATQSVCMGYCFNLSTFDENYGLTALLSCIANTFRNKSDVLALRFVRISFSSTAIILKTPSSAFCVT